MSLARWLDGLRRSMHRAAKRGQQQRRRFQPHLEILETRLAPVVNLSIANPAPFPEGDSGTTDMMFVVTRSGELEPAVSVNYTTRDGTAIAGTDYQARSGTLIFAPNQTTATIAVPIIGNTLPQPNRTFTVELSNPVQGAANFASHQTFGTGTNPTAVAVKDLNGDGLLDMIVTNVNSANVSVFRNTTTPGASVPSFAIHQTFPTSTFPFSVAVGDINGDGLPDLAIANRGAASVSLLLNQTAPGSSSFSFLPQQTLLAGNNPTFVALGDLNGDGRPDLAVTNRNSETVSVLFNQTAPGDSTVSFTPQQTFGTGMRPYCVAMVDINGDGKPDLAVANKGSDSVWVYLNQTEPGATTPIFAPRQIFFTGFFPQSIAVADYNGDGLLDLAVACDAAYAVSVLLNQTVRGSMTASFTPHVQFATDRDPTSVAVADFNLDGRPDLATANIGSTTVSVLMNETTTGAMVPRFAPQQLLTVNQGPYSVAVGDINGDGKIDLAVANRNAFPYTASVLLNTLVPVSVAANFTLHQQTSATGSIPFSVAVADFNADGKPDLAIANATASGMVSVLLNTTAPGGAPSFGPAQSIPVGILPRSVAVGDLNGDGRPDLAVANSGTSSNSVSVLLNTTAPGATTASFASHQTFGVGTAPLSVTLGDFNGDGKLDLVVANSTSNTVSVLLNETEPGAATPSFAAHQTFAAGGRPYSVAVGDLNGDGKPDLAVANGPFNTVSVLLNETMPGATVPSFSMQQTFATGNDPRSVTLGDVNGDGKPDLAVANYGSNSVSVLLNTTAPGATTPNFAMHQAFATGSNPLSVVIGNLNGDGRPDLAVANRFGNTVSVLHNATAPGATTPNFVMQQTFAVAAGSLVPALAAADFNGDGKPDLAVTNSGSATLSVLMNSAAPITIQSSPATGTIQDDDPASGLVVTTFMPTSTGFTASFSQLFVAADLNLYDAQPDNFGPADVTVTGPNGLVRGSLVVNGHIITFIATGDLLPGGMYSVVLRSASNGFHTTSQLLDGNADGTAGDNYTNTFFIAFSSTVIVTVPDFARGPGQTVNVPATSGNGIPLRLSQGNGVTSVNLTLRYNPALLNITGAARGPSTPPTATVTLDTSTPGRAVITFTTPLLGLGAIDFVTLTASVPSNAAYTSKHILDITNLTVNGGVALDNDGLHVAAYLGDATGNGTLSSSDATRALRVAVGLDSGFAAYQLADPAILADVNGNGVVNSTDATRILQEAVGIDRPEIPALPAMPPPIVLGGPDPLLSLPKRLRGRPGSVLVVPVNLEPSEGLESADLALSFDTSQLEVVSVRRGRLTRDFDLFAVNLDAEAGTLRVGLGRSAGSISGRGKGSVLLITFRIKPDAAAGRTIINLRQDVGTTFTQLNEGRLDLIPDPSNAAGDVLDGELTIRGRTIGQRLRRTPRMK